MQAQGFEEVGVQDRGSLLRGLISPSAITKPLTGMSESELESFRDLPPSESEDPDTAASRAGASGLALSSARMLSSVTSPASIAMAPLGILGKLKGIIGGAARGVTTGAGLGFGTAGAVELAESSDLPPGPEKLESQLGAASQVVGAVPAAVQTGQLFKRAAARARNIGKVQPAEALASLTKPSTKMDVVEDMARPAIDDFVATAKRLNIKGEDLRGPQGPDNVVRVASEAKRAAHAEFESLANEYRQVYGGNNQIDTKKVAADIFSKITQDMLDNKPEMASALYQEGIKWLSGGRTFDSLEQSRTRLNQEVRSFEAASQSGQIHDLKTNARVIAANAERHAVKDIVYNEVAKVAKPGTDIGGLKARESVLIDLEEALTSQKNLVKGQQAIYKGKTSTEVAEQKLSSGIAFTLKIPVLNAILREMEIGSPVSLYGGGAQRIMDKGPKPIPPRGAQPTARAALVQILGGSIGSGKKSGGGHR